MSALYSNNSTLGTQVFSAIAICVISWYGMKALDFDKIAVRFVRLDAEPVATATATATATAAPTEGVKGVENAVSIANILATMHPKTESMDATEKGKNQSRAQYIARFYKTAIEEQKQFGIPASITLAQGILESNAGNSPLAKKNNNHFGIKCFSTRCGKGHCTNATDDSHKDFFVKYPKAWNSYRAHSKLLKGANYAQCFTCGNDYKCWATNLQARGYATSQTYARDLIRIIELYELDKLDRL